MFSDEPFMHPGLSWTHRTVVKREGSTEAMFETFVLVNLTTR